MVATAARPIRDMVDQQLRDAMNEVPNEVEHFHSLADLLLRKIVTEQRSVVHSELTFFKSRLGWDEPEVRKQLVRVRNLMRNEAVVGTAAQRQALTEEQSKAREALETEKPKLQKRLQAIQEQIDSLERSAAQADRRSEQIQLAAAEITKIEALRPDRFAEYNAKLNEFATSTWQQMNALGIEISFREQLLSPQTPVENLIEHVRMTYRDCVERNEYNGRFEFVEPNWSNRKQTLRDELIDMQIEFAKYEEIKAEQMAELDALRNFYLEAIG
jgi:hypothetical protein